MFKRLLTCSDQSNLDVGRRVLPRLKHDVRLADPASVLEVAYNELEASWQAVLAGEAAVRDTEAARDDLGRKVAHQVRGLGVRSLCVNDNRHDAQPYVLYFPDGYGDLRNLKAPELIRFAGRVVTMLETETDPDLVVFREKIAASCAEFVPVQKSYEDAVLDLADRKAFGQASRRRFVRALAKARNMAGTICDENPAYVREIFRPAASPKYRASKAPEEVEVPQGDTVPVPQAVPKAAEEQAA